ncbi:hypothetical protein, partial [Priestia flexa]|uniref:hypothetical protein n=1 Tax=Priestia flexa TaxID=86664 RepID=UPI003D052117
VYYLCSRVFVFLYKRKNKKTENSVKIYATLVIFYKKINAWFSLLSGALFVFSLYIAMITSISF